MAMMVCWFLLLLSIYQCRAVFINVASGNDLMNYLCHHRIDQEITILLNHSLAYDIRSNQSCVVNGTGSLSITSDDIVNISCNSTNYTSNISFGFVLENVAISNITFIGCGAPLRYFNSESFISAINSSTLTFSNTSFAVLVFVECRVILTSVVIDSYYGFAVIAFNIQSGSTFVNSKIKAGLSGEIYSKNFILIGSGMLIYFTSPLQTSSIVLLQNCTFLSNNNLFFKDSCVNRRSYKINEEGNSFVLTETGSSLAIVFNQLQLELIKDIVVSIESSTFTKNTGGNSGGLMVLMKNSSIGKVCISRNTIFSENFNYPLCPGCSLTFHMISCNQGNAISHHQPLLLENVTFVSPVEPFDLKKNGSIHQQVHVYINIRNVAGIVDFMLQNVHFKSHSKRHLDRSMLVTVQQTNYSYSSKVRVFLENIQACDHPFDASKEYTTFNTVLLPDVGLFVFDNVHKVNINGSSSLFSNIKGSVIQTLDSNVHVSGNIVFRNNVAKSGAAFKMMQSFLYLCHGLFMNMTNNFAQVFGGAIYILNHFNTVVPKCAIQIENFNSSHVLFSGSLANYSGNSIYSVPLYQCYMINYGLVQSDIYSNYFKFPVNSSNDLLDISSEVYDIIYCNSNRYNACRLFSNAMHYPGTTIKLLMAAIDKTGNHVSSIVKLSLITNIEEGYIKYSNSSVSEAEMLQSLHESRNSSYSTIKVTVKSHDPNNDSLKLLVSSYESSVFTTVSLDLRSCPPGFRLTNGVCNCSLAVEKYFEIIGYQDGHCDINSLSIFVSPFRPNVWLGKFPSFGISDACPFDICMRAIDFSKQKPNVISLPNFAVKLADNSKICMKHRTGALCGECEKGYSVVFGSGICMKCSNWWLLTGFLYAIIGPLLVYFIYALNLTLSTGTINGIIFYAQAANISTLLYIQYFQNEGNEAYQKFVSIFLSLLNLNLGFPICFFDGMNEFVKNGLNIAFPLYLLFIVVLLIILSRYSVWLSNRTSHLSVQVLVTVVHISFSNLLNAIITVITPATIFFDHGGKLKTLVVWNRNGSVPFNSHDHVIITASIVTIAGTFLVPYTCLLITGRCVLKLSCGARYFRAAYEAIHGPYKEKRHFWFSARLFLLIAMFVTHSSLLLRASFIVILLMLIVFLFFQLLLQPFKNNLVNILDSLVLLNLVLFYLAVSYESVHGHVRSLYAVVIGLITLFLLQFVFIISYHVLSLTNSRTISTLQKLYRERITCRFYNAPNNERSHLLSDTSTFYQPCNNFREPLLDHQD